VVEPSDPIWPPDLEGGVPVRSWPPAAPGPEPEPPRPGPEARGPEPEPPRPEPEARGPEPEPPRPEPPPPGSAARSRAPTEPPKVASTRSETPGVGTAPSRERTPGVSVAPPREQAPGVYPTPRGEQTPGVYAVAPPAAVRDVRDADPATLTPRPRRHGDGGSRRPGGSAAGRHDEGAPTRHPFTPTADEFARRRAARPADPVAQFGARAAVRRATLGLVRLGPGPRELEYRNDVDMIRRNFGGLRQVTVVNPKGGAGKTVAALLLAMTFGQRRGGYVLAWDNNETQGTLGMRAHQDYHSRTVRDLLRDLPHFAGANGRVGDLSQYVRAQGEGMFDVLASDESATAGEMLTATAFGRLREVVSRFYKLIMVDTGNNVRAENWQAAIDATDQLVVTMSARNDSAETAARMLDHLEQTGRQRIVRQAVTVVSLPPSRKDIDLPAIRRHFAARTRVVLLAPYDRLIDTGEPLRYAQLSAATHAAWLKIAAAVADGL
jgi:MinD-like ATPase involved in chromosome partitioning or flagellar assembly